MVAEWSLSRPGGPAWVAWLRSVGWGLALGTGLVAAQYLGLQARALEIASLLNRTIGPVWIPMALVGLRVGWLGARALRTRFGRGRPGRGVRGELSQLAPLFAALGLCGTVWGLSRAFGALAGGDFLTQLPALLGGLGTAMSSTLAGLGLQIATLLLAAFNPAWSEVRVEGDSRGLRVALDGCALGEGEQGLASLADAIEGRRPEALRLAFGPGVPAGDRAALRRFVWQRSDGEIPLREARSS